MGLIELKTGVAKKGGAATVVVGLLVVGELAAAQPAAAVPGLCGDYNTSRAVNAVCSFPIKSRVTVNFGTRYEGPAAYRGQSSWQLKNYVNITSYGWARV
ncbi:hypothetical protein HNP00_004028 [Arthrobacter sp. AZCC_0090]|nr:hypothetical protein [Arthrobacter sp. AZCC_0090]